MNIIEEIKKQFNDITVTNVFTKQDVLNILDQVELQKPIGFKDEETAESFLEELAEDLTRKLIGGGELYKLVDKNSACFELDHSNRIFLDDVDLDEGHLDELLHQALCKSEIMTNLLKDY